MSFDGRLQKRWIEIISPGIRNVTVNGKRLEPIRVDARQISDSIVTEILSGIGNSRFVLADITAIGNQGARPSANVMYEVGIAHAVRLPEEILLFRSDHEPLIFDVANVRVNNYAPDENPEAARQIISNSIIAASRELDLRRHLAVRKAVESLDAASWRVLMEACNGKIAHPKTKTMGQALANSSRVRAIERLLEMGAIRSSFLTLTPEKYESIKDSTDAELLTYECTEFGQAVIAECYHCLGLDSPAMSKLFEREFSDGENRSLRAGTPGPHHR
jgi:hypothetical protein